MIYTTARTPIVHHGLLAFDRDGNEQLVVVVKCTYRLTDRHELVLDEEQLPIFHTDQFLSDPATSSIRYEADTAPRKQGIDLLINATAHARKPVPELYVDIQTRSFRKRLLVTGDREWHGGVLGQRPSQAKPFTEMPLTYERAFGGVDLRGGPGRAAAELRNPIGRGFCAASPADGTPLPNIEDPSQPISNWNDRPTPIGLGIVGRGWRPRISRAGTYDAAWMATRFPLLPADFDEAHFSAAPDDQVLRELRPGEVVLLRNLTHDGDLRVEVPQLSVPVYARWNRRAERVDATPDTMIIEPDLNRVVLVCRLALPVGQKPDKLREVIVGELGRGEERAVLTGKRFLPLSSLGVSPSDEDQL
jgi:hypothetical protein